VTFAALIAHRVCSGWAEAGLAVFAILGFVSFIVAVRPAESA
jgi:hypothetical protein